MSEKLEYIKCDEMSQADLADMKAEFEELMICMEEAQQQAPRCNRSASLALMHLEEAFMWEGKTIRDIQLAKTREKKW